MPFAPSYRLGGARGSTAVSDTFGPDLETGIAEIDAQHRAIFGTLQNLDTALALGDEDSPNIALRILSRYVLDHFETEERWMRRTAYPRIREHMAKHDNFVAALVAMTNEHAGAGASAVLALRLRNALSWLRDHIESEDQLLSCHLEPEPVATADGVRAAP
jgi:hemerythrin